MGGHDSRRQRAADTVRRQLLGEFSASPLSRGGPGTLARSIPEGQKEEAFAAAEKGVWCAAFRRLPTGQFRDDDDAAGSKAGSTLTILRSRVSETNANSDIVSFS